MSKFVRFAVLSGCGWVLDFCLLLILVRAFRVPPLFANIVSSTTAASAVFLTSRAFIFDQASGGFHARFGLFLFYTMSVILIASFAIGALAARMPAMVAVLGVGAITLTQAAAIAKILVTPPQLVLNFAVSRMLSEHSGFRTKKVND